MRYDLSDFEWSVIQPQLPNKPRGVKRVDDRRVLNGELGEITVEPDPVIQAIVATWATETEFARATALGLPREANLDEIVEAYIEDFLDA
jgi:hypothetical protein